MAKAKRLSKVMAVLLALVMLLAVLPMGALADYELFSVSAGGSLSITMNLTAHTGTISPTGSYVPDQFTLYVEGVNTVSPGTGITVVDSYTEPSNDPDHPNDYNTIHTINTAGLSAAGSITVSITSSNYGLSDDYTISVPKPTGSITAGAKPSAVVSYLPIGQFATGAGWGSSSGKFTTGTGYASTGVSLGAFGGYIEFDFGEGKGISENSKNPYGVDFVVYGNAFHNNPEAGAVQVSVDGTEWYELAGSLYYDGGFNYVGNQMTNNSNKFSAAYTGVLQNSDVIYKLGSSGITVTLKDANNNAKFTDETFCNVTNWWPTTTEYPDSVIAAAHQDTNVTIARSGDTTNSTLAYGGVTAIPDSNDISDYAFGYADVTPNGTISTYGTAINPYTPYTTNNSKTGGDGFDLSWAVNIGTGEPVNVIGKVFRYVRVYSAVLDNGTFGETSTEVCGIFATANPATDDVGTTTIDNSNPPISFGTTAYNLTGVATTYKGIEDITVNGSSFKIRITSNVDNIFINSQRATSGTTYTFDKLASGQLVRIILQDGTAAPYITYIRVN